MAEAYHRLDRAQTIFSDEFAHSCYHYGRLLRKKDNPVEAMQAFLAATHSRTRGYNMMVKCLVRAAQHKTITGPSPTDSRIKPQDTSLTQS